MHHFAQPGASIPPPTSFLPPALGPSANSTDHRGRYIPVGQRRCLRNRCAHDKRSYLQQFSQKPKYHKRAMHWPIVMTSTNYPKPFPHNYLHATTTARRRPIARQSASAEIPFLRTTIPFLYARSLAPRIPTDRTGRVAWADLFARVRGPITAGCRPQGWHAQTCFVRGCLFARPQRTDSGHVNQRENPAAPAAPAPPPVNGAQDGHFGHRPAATSLQDHQEVSHLASRPLRWSARTKSVLDAERAAAPRPPRLWRPSFTRRMKLW